MPKQAYLQRRGNQFQFRRRVPAELRGVVGKTEWITALGADAAQAKRRAHILAVETDNAIAVAQNSASLEGNRLARISDAAAVQLVASWGNRRVAEAEAPMAIGDEYEDGDTVTASDLVQEFDKAQLRLRRLEEGGEAANAIYANWTEWFLRDAGMKEPKDDRVIPVMRPGAILAALSPEEVQPLRQAIAPYVQRAAVARVRSARPPGHPVPLDPFCGRAESRRRTVRDLIQAYLDDPTREDRSAPQRREFTVATNILTEVVGAEKCLSDIDVATMTEVVAFIRQTPPNANIIFPGMTYRQAAEAAAAKGAPAMKESTASKYVAQLTRLFEWGVEQEYLNRNPIPKRLRKRPPHTADDRHAFSADQLRTIFSQPIFTGCVDDERNYRKPGPNKPRRARFWIPLLALFTGCHLNELCQLRPEDVAEKDGILCLNITDAGMGQALKTASSRRVVPVHPDLLEIGFASFARSRQRSGEPMLFPDITQDSRGYHSDLFQKWFSRFLKGSGAAVPKTSFHSFRHSFRDAARECGMEEEVCLAIGGWSRNQLQRRYGNGPSVALMFREVSKLRFEGLDLDALKAAPDERA